MRIVKLVGGLVVAGTLLTTPAALAQTALTYADLVGRLTDLDALAVPPQPGESCQQWSSYDRKSKFDASTGKYVEWDANGDGDGIIRKEGDKLVLVEMDGPGCIWRIWSADPRQGHVRIYLDGVETPVVDLPFIGYFDRKHQPFTRPSFVHTASRGWNNYTPIPYQKSCKIVAEPGWGLYYQFTYQTFPKGTTLPTFSADLAARNASALDHADEVLGRGFQNTAVGQKTLKRFVTLNGGKSAEVAAFKGAGAITRLRARVEPEVAPGDMSGLRELALSISWDGESEPSVWSPLGDFFGSACGAGSYQSLPLGKTADGWYYCNWYMPYGKSARIALSNEGKTRRKVSFEVTHAPLSKPADQLARFHAKWHRDAFLPAAPERGIDWPMLVTQGTGRFVGVMLHIWNPRGSWWGEGDEKFFVDGEKFPSTFGTGSEDYFGYAWCDPGLFQNAYHNQTHNDGNNKGHVSVNRWHIADNVPFQRSFEGDIEKYYPNARPTLYAATTYWYLRPGGRDPYAAAPVSERIGYWIPVETYKVKGALEGEKLKVLARTGGTLQEQDMTAFAGQWSNDAHLWWTGAKPGNRIELAVPTAKPGRYKVVMHFTKAPDYGVMKLTFDGKPAGDLLDLYHPSVVPTAELNMGSFDLGAGEHKLAIEVVGANEKAVKAYMCGFDYLRLEPIP